MAKREKTILICETPAIAAHYTESIGPLPIYRGESFAVTTREADAYTLFGMARRATEEEVAAVEALEAYKAQIAAEIAEAEAVKEAELQAQAQAEAKQEAAQRRAMVRAATAE